MPAQITCSFVGLGLIGGSVAKALRQHNTNLYIKVYDIDSAVLVSAKETGLADEVYSSLTAELCQCDYAFLCAPVAVNLQNLKSIAPLLPENCIVTDVGSVKGGIHKRVRELDLCSSFIGGHPMTGSERIGFSNSDAALLENAYYILTPEPEVPKERIHAFFSLIQSTGALPLILDTKKHDLTTAAISHLPHLIASALVNLIREEDGQENIFRTLAAGGFKDITRIASASPVLWQQICLENSENILFFLDQYIEHLKEIREHLTKRHLESLYSFFEEARNYRDSFADTRSGPLMKQYVLTLDIPDKTGALASVVALLASENISIKNIGIVHNREFQEGVLRMEFYSLSEYGRAQEILTERGYQIHKYL